jgi:hypothetical protein
MATQMTLTTKLAGSKLAESASRIGRRYAGGAERPLGGYVATMTVYSSVVGVLAGAAVLAGREVPAEGMSARDVLLAAAATHKLSRLLTRDPVTSPLRAPFTSYEGTAGPAELAEDARGHGAQKAVGELITCPFCASVWVATGLTAGLVFLPRTTRLAMGTFAALAGADMLQFARAWLTKSAG